MTSQSHFTISFPLKSPADARAVAELIPSLMPELFQAADNIGTIHYLCFTVLSEKTLLFLGDFDGAFIQLMSELARQAGPVFDTIFQHVDSAPSTPVADNEEAFIEWTASHLLGAATLFSAFPEMPASAIKSLASVANIRAGREVNAFLMTMPIQSGFAFMELQLLLRSREYKTQKELAMINTLHFAQFVPLENNQVGFFTVYDGPLAKYIADFTRHIGPVFDLIFKFTKGPPRFPCRKHLQAFIEFAAEAKRTPIGFYQAYPGLTAQAIHALIADSDSQSGSSRFEDFAA